MEELSKPFIRYKLAFRPIFMKNKAFTWLLLKTTLIWQTFLCAQLKTITSYMQFQKTVLTFTCRFKKSCNILSSTGETIRHFAKKKTRLQMVILTACKKTFFRVAKCWNSCHFTFFGRFSETLFFFLQLFLKNAILNQLFM